MNSFAKTMIAILIVLLIVLLLSGCFQPTKEVTMTDTSGVSISEALEGDICVVNGEPRLTWIGYSGTHSWEVLYQRTNGDLVFRRWNGTTILISDEGACP